MNIVYVFVASLWLSTTSCLALAQSPCEPIKDYYGKGRNDISVELKKLNALQLNDIVDQATECKNSSSALYAANPVSLAGGTTAEESTIKKSAQFVLDASASIAADEQKKEQERKATEDSLKGFNFAVGVGTILLQGTDIRAAVVDQGVVRVTDEEKYKIGLWLSTNTYFAQSDSKRSRWGLFLATQLGGSGNNSDLLNSFAVGLSFASQPGTNQSKGSPGNAPLVFQIGYGVTRIQTFADGYSNGMVLPAGTSQPLMKKTTRDGAVLLVSYGFE